MICFNHRMRKIIIVLAVLIVLVTIHLLRRPHLDRMWDEDVRVLASVDLSDEEQKFTMGRIRNWKYDSAGPISKEYFDETYKLDDLQGMYLYEQILDGKGLIAHTFIVFDFGESYANPRLGISVETRREVGEKYSIVKGALRGFELTHMWATEADLVQRRVKYLKYSLTKYHILQPLEHQRMYLTSILAQTHSLATKPQWYNTFVSNCTNVIINVANSIEPGYLPFDKSFIFTGLAAEYLMSHGVLDDEAVVNIDLTNIDSFIESLTNRSGTM